MSLTQFLKGLAKGYLDVQKERLELKAKRMKRKAVKTAWSISLGILSGLFLFVGVIVILTRWIALEWVLLGTGVILGYTALLVHLSK